MGKAIYIRKLDPSDVAISVDDVSKYFAPAKGQGSIKQAVTSLFKPKSKRDTSKGFWALKDISFQIKKGEFFGIVGRNGSGKSTLLKMIAGIYTPSSGHIAVNGNIVPFIELGVGFNPELSGRDNVFLNGALLGFTRREMELIYEEVVSFAELEDHMDVKLKNFSSGMQVRLAFSIAIRAKTDILLIDEVLAVGDAAFQQKCFSYFEELRKNKQTVIFVSHDMNSVRRFCDRSIYMKDGKVTHEGSPEDISDIYAEANISNENHDADNLVITRNGTSLESSISGGGMDYELCMDFKHSGPEELFLGISIIKDGFTIAEISTEKTAVLHHAGKMVYRVDAKSFNGGSYGVRVGLFKLENRELIAVSKHAHPFVVKRSDISRGGALFLPDNWEVMEDKSAE